MTSLDEDTMILTIQSEFPKGPLKSIREWLGKTAVGWREYELGLGHSRCDRREYLIVGRQVLEKRLTAQVGDGVLADTEILPRFRHQCPRQSDGGSARLRGWIRRYWEERDETGIAGAGSEVSLVLTAPPSRGRAGSDRRLAVAGAIAGRSGQSQETDREPIGRW